MNNNVTTQFTNEQHPTLQLLANADFLGTGAIEINMYEREIFDIVRRTSPTLEILNKPMAQGQPHRYFEQTAIATGAFTDPRNISPSATSPTRVERYATIKALVAQSNISLFDKEVTQQQGQFAQVIGQDIDDILNGIIITSANAIWNGTDTSLTAPTTNQYVGLLTQITQQATILTGSSIIDGLKAQIALMVSNINYRVKPDVIIVNPILGDLIDRETKAQQRILDQVEVTAGLKVNAISTQAGLIPILTDPFLPATTDTSYGFPAPPANEHNYFAAILTRNLVEMPYVNPNGDSNPRLFQLGLLGNLTDQYVGIKFDAILAKGASYAHSIVAVQR